jgi:hypothetical protein
MTRHSEKAAAERPSTGLGTGNAPGFADPLGTKSRDSADLNGFFWSRSGVDGGGDAALIKLGPQRTKLLVKSNNRNFIVDAQDVVYATIDDGLITVVATSVEGESNYRTIEELQSNLDPATFWRVHRSFLVNIHRIKEVIPWFKSSFQLRMDDKKQSEIPVSLIQTKRLRALLKLYALTARPLPPAVKRRLTLFSAASRCCFTDPLRRAATSEWSSLSEMPLQ